MSREGQPAGCRAAGERFSVDFAPEKSLHPSSVKTAQNDLAACRRGARSSEPRIMNGLRAPFFRPFNHLPTLPSADFKAIPSRSAPIV
jgi:hypothetical protein